jgi:hypothetical protein
LIARISAEILPRDLLLRGVVAGLLRFHLVSLTQPGPRPALRSALAAFARSLPSCLSCQRAAPTTLLPSPVAHGAPALRVSSTA